MTTDQAQSPPARPNRREPWLIGLWLVMAVLGSFFIANYAVPKFTMTEAEYTEFYWGRRYWLFAHLCGGLLALLAGPLQFIVRIRQRSPVLHRWIGRSYLLATLVAALTAIWLAWTSPVPQPLYAIGLYLVAALWLLTGWRGWTLIRRRALPAHREWMIRNYAVTFFFVMFFGVYDGIMALGWPGERWDVAVTLAVWIGIAVPLGVAEGIIRARRRA